MKSQTSILIVTQQDVEDQELFDTAFAERYSLIHLKGSLDAIKWIKQNGSPALLLMDEKAKPLNAHQCLEYLRTEMKSQIPVLIICETGISGKSATLDNVDYVALPFSKETEEQLAHMLNAVPPKPISKEEKRYSLEYLNQIGGEDSEYIVESLRIFSTSVEERLALINDLLKNEDYRGIGKVAHNIKPSFEMIENEAGTALCNKLTYIQTEDKVPVWIKELNNEFLMVKGQLEEDFPIIY